MLKAKLLPLSLLLLSFSPVSYSQPDVIRERQGLEVLVMQLEKLNELSRAIQQSADPQARVQFNYSAFQMQTESLRRAVQDFLYQPLKPQPQSVIDSEFSDHQDGN